MRSVMHLEQRQFMKLVLTPQMHQALHILQASAPELGEYLERIAANNPFLEIEWKDGGVPFHRVGGASGTADSRGGFERMASSSGGGLEAHLLQQLRMSGCPKRTEKIAAFLIGNVDEAGYLRIRIPEAASILNVSEEETEEALRLLQSFDPPGIAARSLQECLLLQIQSHDDPAPYAEEIIAHHIEDLASSRVQLIMKSLGIGREELEEAVHFIQSLNPRPGMAFSPAEESYVVPDAEIAVTPDGRLEIRMLDASLPAVTMLEEYRELFDGGDVDPALREKWNEALAIVASLEKRKSTLHRLIVTIAEAQREFFRGGWECLRALTNKDLAKMLDLHESTVSRAMQNKYVLTPCGVIALKSLLSTPLPTSRGTPVSARAVKNKIAQLIREEDKRAPLSDQKIAEFLQADGIMISRRGVTKYRHELKIMSAPMRRVKPGRRG